jgi:hypothetical protein
MRDSSTNIAVLMAAFQRDVGIQLISTRIEMATIHQDTVTKTISPITTIRKFLRNYHPPMLL